MTRCDSFCDGLLPTVWKFIVAVWLAVPTLAVAQSNLTIYADSLANGWQDSSYDTTRNFANTSPVHSGSDSISVTVTNAWGALQLYHPDLTNSAYAGVSFWLNGGPSGGQQLLMYGTLDVNGANTAQNARFFLNSPPIDTWQQYTVPLSALGVANATNFTGFDIEDAVGSTEPTFYVDDIQLATNVPPPALVHLTVNASQPVRTADARWFGINAAVWDNAFDTPQTVTELMSLGRHALRFPGGGDSDGYHWFNESQVGDNWTWPTSAADFIHVFTNLNAQAMTTLNYGTGSTNEAAAWVAYANASTTNTQSLGVDAGGTNWHTAGYWASLRASAPLAADDGQNFLRISRPAPLGFKYWEIGNEVYGTWEMDSNSLPHDPYTYARRARDYIALIKAVDPTVKIGVVVTPGEDSFVNYTSHAAVNPRTGLTHYGWTPVMLATLTSLGVTPDFLVHHRYPQYAGGETDPGLLQSTSGWASDAQALRQLITDYVGANGTNIELVCTEHNSVGSAAGKQTTSLVNGLFMADSFGQLMQTEFNGLFWWDFRDGVDSSGNNSSSLYGWRLYGDYGVLDGTNLYPTYYMQELIQDFVQPGDTVLTAASDYALLPTYAVRRADGSLTILTVNKDPANTFTGQVAVAGYAPASSGTVYSYGMPQDNAAESGIGSPGVAQTNFSGAGTNFTYIFPPYSATVLSLPPAPATLLATSVSPAGQFIFQLQGQAGVPYIIQWSTNLVSWISTSTNPLPGGTMRVTNSLTPAFPMQFWRAVWQP